MSADVNAICDWLWHNKEWMFSGIGIGMVVLIWRLMVWIHFRRRTTRAYARKKSSDLLSASSVYEKVMAGIADRTLSGTLTDVIVLAQLIEDQELERWARLESGGYLAENSALRDSDKVPLYRTVVGQYRDSYGRPLMISDPKLLFVNEERLRMSVAELEGLAGVKELLHMSDPRTLSLIKDHLGVTVHEFVFGAPGVKGALEGIRQELLRRLRKIRQKP
jgi:hypothetical protein